MSFVIEFLGYFTILPPQCLQLGPDFWTFLTKLVRIWSGILSKVRIFQNISKITHEIGFVWHLLNESANVNFTEKVLKSLDFSTESGFLMQMVRIWSGFLKKLVRI